MLPLEVSKAMADFKAREMAVELERVMKEGVERFKVEELPEQLQSEFVQGSYAFPYTEEGEKFLREEWGAGLVEYRDAVLHYHPDLDARKIDRHFPDIFPYARIEGEILPEIIVRDSLGEENVTSVAHLGDVDSSDVAPSTAANGDDPALP